MNISEAKLHPEALFKNPNEIYNHSEISYQEKIDILLAWKNQLERKISSTSEGLTFGKANHSRDDEELVLVGNLIRQLKEKNNIQ